MGFPIQTAKNKGAIGLDFLFTGENWLFTAGIVVMLGLGLLELVAVMVGGSLSGFLDGLIPDMGGAGEGLAWLHLGRVPALIVLVLLLAMFSVLGFLLQGLAHAIFGAYIPSLPAAAVALLGALPATRSSAGLIAHILPRDETYSIRNASFLGRTAVVVAGMATKGRAAEAKFEDEHGQTHYVLVEPESEASVLMAGERVLLLRQVGSARFVAVPNPVVE